MCSQPRCGLPVSLRANGKLIALDEIIIGADQDFDEVRKQFEAVLASKGYVEGRLGTGGFREKGAKKPGVTSMAGFASGSGVACMAGFAGARRPHPGRDTTTPAVLR